MEISMHVPFEYFPPHFSMQSFPFVLDGLNSAMNFIYPDRVDGLNSSMNYIYPDMDLVQSIDVNLRHKNTKKYKRFNRQTNNLKKEWEGNTITSYYGMCDIIGKYQILVCNIKTIIFPTSSYNQISEFRIPKFTTIFFNDSENTF